MSKQLLKPPPATQHHTCCCRSSSTFKVTPTVVLVLAVTTGALLERVGPEGGAAAGRTRGGSAARSTIGSAIGSAALCSCTVAIAFCTAAFLEFRQELHGSTPGDNGAKAALINGREGYTTTGAQTKPTPQCTPLHIHQGHGNYKNKKYQGYAHNCARCASGGSSAPPPCGGALRCDTNAATAVAGPSVCAGAGSGQTPTAPSKVLIHPHVTTGVKCEAARSVHVAGGAHVHPVPIAAGKGGVGWLPDALIPHALQAREQAAPNTGVCVCTSLAAGILAITSAGAAEGICMGPCAAAGLVVGQ